MIGSKVKLMVVIKKIILSPNEYLVTINGNGFKGLYKGESIIANCLNQPHDENEMVRRPIDDKYFKYKWQI